ncbi:MAG: phosphoenolpyruvate carboxykinase (ATP) [Chloroflexota bacterium]
MVLVESGGTAKPGVGDASASRASEGGGAHDLLASIGVHTTGAVSRNLPPARLVEEVIRRGEGALGPGGAVLVDTGHHTGRSPQDKFVVRDAVTADTVWWGPVNRPFAPEAFDALLARVADHVSGRDLFVQDLAGGADPAYRLPIRVVTEHAWQSLFAQNLFLRPDAETRATQVPGFTVFAVPSFQADPARDGTRSSTFVILNFTRRIVLIGGTEYAGEIKKSIFTVLNYLLPQQGILPMHASANIGEDGTTALFFGLSGTGKTTLSTDPARTLIGDDEHGWGANGLFNFEGGCYAKVINLSASAEPEIFATTHQFGTVLENVVYDPATHVLDLDSEAKTENTRGAYPLDFIPNASADGVGGHPAHVLLLTCDAFGVLPPVSRLTTPQALYHFLCGYTAKVAGTEIGLTAPEATFSSCFGEPFLPLSPVTYANMLGERLAHYGSRVWLVNTGWTGGVYGVGKRMSIAHTRAIVRAILEGSLDHVAVTPDPHFGMGVPVSCPGVPTEVLTPRRTWADGDAFDATARDLAGRFASRFAQFANEVGPEVRTAGPH